MCDEVNFVDILEPRRTESGIFKFMTRSWRPHRTFQLDKWYSPQELKDIVAKSVFLDSYIEAECARTGIRKEKLKKDVINYLDEMGFEKRMCTIRWMGIGFLKVCFMMKVGVYVNEPAVLQLKSTMGRNPVLFLPTHRSYADFCLLTYLCYHYDIEFPAVAAGMDFYSMAIFGQRMRETGAFYIRRTLAGAPLYAATLKQYVRTVIAKYAAPIEFFLEGTRSRSNKSLPPKYGMLSMSLVPLFTREVTDITIVPVNISYDRLMEHGLFAYEHIGVPKPKESTGGLIKSLFKLNDHYGNIYINCGAPLSVRTYLKDVSYTDETLKPVDIQQLTSEQFKQVQSVANYVVTLQQKCTVATISNLLALVLMDCLLRNQPLVLGEVLSEVERIIQVLRVLGASVFENDVSASVDRILLVHREMMMLDKERRLRLVSGKLMDVSTDVQKKMKGHILKAKTMVNAIPIIQLQMYVNPVLHYLVPPAFVYLIVDKASIAKDDLITRYHKIRKLFHHEFFYIKEAEEEILNVAVEYCLQNDVIAANGDRLSAAGDDKLKFLLKWSVWPALTTMIKCADIMIEQISCAHKQALKLVQERVETSLCHPYCLSLESIANCMQGLVLGGALVKEKLEQDILYKLVPDAMEDCRNFVRSILPSLHVDFSSRNSVILDHANVLSRL